MELPSSDVRRGLVRAYAAVLESLELESHGRPIVLPNGEFFPDPFTGDGASVQRLLDRLLEHAGLSDMAISARLVGEPADASCGTGACGSCGPTPEAEPENVERLVDAGDAWQINVLPKEVGQPVALSSALCRAVALAVLCEADHRPKGVELELAIDLSAVALGYGVLLLEGSHIYRKSCGGPAVSRTTTLGPTELALVLALSAAVNDQPRTKVGKYLSPTQQEAFAEAAAWADSNPALAQSLRRAPERIALGEFELKEATSWLGRWVARTLSRPKTAEAALTIEDLETALENSNVARPPSQKPRDPKLEEIRRLVDEALSE